MAMTVDELQVLITAQTSKFNSEIAKVQSQISGLDKNVKNTSTNMTKSFGSLAAKVISVGAIIKATASSITRAMNYIEDEIKQYNLAEVLPCFLTILLRSIISPLNQPLKRSNQQWPECRDLSKNSVLWCVIAK